MNSEDLRYMSEVATPGKLGQFSPAHGPWQEMATNFVKQKSYSAIDTSHHMSAMVRDMPYRIAEFKHANDAAFAEMLVNLYREGKLHFDDDLIKARAERDRLIAILEWESVDVSSCLQATDDEEDDLDRLRKAGVYTLEDLRRTLDR